MEIAYLIIGLTALWILKSIAVNQFTQAKNQVQISKLLKELINEVSGEKKYQLLTHKQIAEKFDIDINQLKIEK